MARPKKVIPESETKVLVTNIQEDTTPVVEQSSDVVTLVISNANLTTVIREVFYLGKIGAKATPKFLPRLKSPPFIVKVDLTPEQALKYAASEGRTEYDESATYNQITIKGADLFKLIETVLEVGAKGGILTPKKVVQTGLTVVIPAISQETVENSPSVSVLPSK